MSPHLVKPDAELIKTWLTEQGQPHYLCGQCHGIHLGELDELGEDDAVETRIFIEQQGVLLTTEMAIRPSQLLALNAELGPLNVEYPQLKVFLDLVDQDMPRLVACDLLLTDAGVTPEQFHHFVGQTLSAVKQLLEYCQPFALSDELVSLEPVTH